MCLSTFLPNSVMKKVKSESISRSVMSDSLRSRGLQPVRLLCPWNSPGKNTGVGGHSLLQVMLNNYDFKRKNSFIKFIDFFHSFIHFSAQLCQTQLDANSIENTYSLVYLLSNPELNKTRGNYRKINKQKKRKFKLLFQSFSKVCTLPLF